jgi:hypothetical protein
MQKTYGATLKLFFIIIFWLLNTEITRGHSWSLVVTRGHSCVLLDKTHFSTVFSTFPLSWGRTLNVLNLNWNSCVLYVLCVIMYSNVRICIAPAS